MYHNLGLDNGLNFRWQYSVTDDGLLWNINCRFLPNVALPRVKESPSSSTLKKVRKQLIGRTFTTHGFCGGELAVTPNTSIKFKDVKLYVPKKPDTQNLIKIRIYYRFTMQNPDNPLVWRATFDAVTGEYLGAGYDFGCR